MAAEQSERRLPSVAAGVVRDGELVWSAGRGAVSGGAPTEDVQYRCGSITKTFVAVCVLRLRDEGALRLTDPVERFLPGTGLGDVSIGQLLSQAGGVRAETAGPWWERTPGGDFDSLVAGSLASGGTRFEAGRRYHYSNVGFAVLGALVASLRGDAWDDVVRRELLEPLEMARTTTRPEAPFAPGLAVHPWADAVLPEPEHDAGAMAPAGQLWTTVADLARWAAFLGGDGSDLLEHSTLVQMREPRAIEDLRGEGWASAYGLGLELWNDRGARSFGHGGSMPGFQAFLEITEHGDAAVGFANATSGLRGELGSDLLRVLNDEEPHLPDEWAPVAPPAGTLEIVGPWYWGAAPYVLRVRHGLLELEGLGAPGRASRFRLTGEDTWEGLDGYHTAEPLTVGRRADGTVSHLDLGSFVYTRTPYDPSAPVPGGVDPAGWGP
ncbi:MAG: D-alanyl-D-alanine carboxypeptidase precursor [Acidimicrobiaceae bacterium]|nr:D-alanyl-D-alanine carboxypeptidase precursor [Acidimicrobiaceae bacterium]